MTTPNSAKTSREHSSAESLNRRRNVALVIVPATIVLLVASVILDRVPETIAVLLVVIVLLLGFSPTRRYVVWPATVALFTILICIVLYLLLLLGAWYLGQDWLRPGELERPLVFWYVPIGWVLALALAVWFSYKVVPRVGNWAQRVVGRVSQSYFPAPLQPTTFLVSLAGLGLAGVASWLALPGNGGDSPLCDPANFEDVSMAVDWVSPGGPHGTIDEAELLSLPISFGLFVGDSETAIPLAASGAINMCRTDPINVIFRGSLSDVKEAFRDAGWVSGGCLGQEERHYAALGTGPLAKRVEEFSKGGFQSCGVANHIRIFGDERIDGWFVAAVHHEINAPGHAIDSWDLGRNAVQRVFENVEGADILLVSLSNAVCSEVNVCFWRGNEDGDRVSHDGKALLIDLSQESIAEALTPTLVTPPEELQDQEQSRQGTIRQLYVKLSCRFPDPDVQRELEDLGRRGATDDEVIEWFEASPEGRRIGMIKEIYADELFTLLPGGDCAILRDDFDSGQNAQEIRATVRSLHQWSKLHR